MGYEVEEIRQSQEIFYYLLEHHELQEEREQLLYRAYASINVLDNLYKSPSLFTKDESPAPFGAVSASWLPLRL